MKHELKTLTKYFQFTWVGRKNFEIRKNDRNFHFSDEVTLLEFDEDAGADHECYTGRSITGIIEYITNYEQKKGYVVFALKVTAKSEGGR